MAYDFMDLKIEESPWVPGYLVPESQFYIALQDQARTYLQPHYGNGVFDNV